MASAGKANSSNTCIDETARNLLYKGKLSMQKLVKAGKFLPHDRNKDSSIPAKKAYFILRLSTNKANNAKKKTTAPI